MSEQESSAVTPVEPRYGDRQEAMQQTDLYFEAHVTIEPIFDRQLQVFNILAEGFGFHVADLLMQKRKEDTPERSKFDTFCTARNKNYIKLESDTLALVRTARRAGFKVWRYKIENTLLDVRLKPEDQMTSDASEISEVGSALQRRANGWGFIMDDLQRHHVHMHINVRLEFDPDTPMGLKKAFDAGGTILYRIAQSAIMQRLAEDGLKPSSMEGFLFGDKPGTDKVGIRRTNTWEDNECPTQPSEDQECYPGENSAPPASEQLTFYGKLKGFVQKLLQM